MIKIVKYNSLNVDKYLECVRKSEQYCYQSEIDFLESSNGEDWEFLVEEDYQAVMPVPIIRKLGIKIVLPPPFAQQLGIFSSKDEPYLNQCFFDFLMKKYRVYYYPFNIKNKIEQLHESPNYYIEQGDYQSVKSRYSATRRRNVRLNHKSNSGLAFFRDLEIKAMQAFFYKNILGLKSEKMKNRYYEVLEELYSRKRLKIFGVKKDEKWVSMAVVSDFPEERALLCLMNDKSVQSNAASIIIDGVLEESIQNQTFNFMGSHIPAIQDFNRRFGAVVQSYKIIPVSKRRLLKI